MGKDEETDMRSDTRRKRLGCASDIIIRCSMLDVRCSTFFFFVPPGKATWFDGDNRLVKGVVY
jgi:hypothetical protein